MDKMLSIEEVMDITGLARSTIRAYVKNGTFPAPFVIGKRKNRWLEADLEAWFDTLERAPIKQEETDETQI